MFEVRGLKTDAYGGKASIGTIFHGEHGFLVSSSYTKLVAYDLEGKEMKVFTGGGNHFQNFLDAVKSGKHEDLNAGCFDGHISSALCHLGNISYRLGSPRPLDTTDKPFGEASDAANESFRRFHEHLAANGIDASSAQYDMGPTLRFNPGTERFEGELAPAANAMLGRKGRGAFRIPSGA